jgi:carbonic anhydrase/acetyltransferase-like protein (isoleucine patch superfamily)
VVASLRGIAVGDKTPQLDKAYFISPDAAIFGDVSMEIGVEV